MALAVIVQWTVAVVSARASAAVAAEATSSGLPGLLHRPWPPPKVTGGARGAAAAKAWAYICI